MHSVLQTPAAARSFVLDGREPDRVFRPETEEEAVEVVREAARDGFALVPWGAGTKIACGNRLRADRWAALDTTGLTRVFEYSPDDMVVTAGAGITLAALQSALGEHNQFLPVESRVGATLGGVTATNDHGLLRATYGLPRDRLLGARIVLSDATVAKGGGKVVKNVAGYDLCKLIAGSWGTLGLITEVTYKTNPSPDELRSICFDGLDGVGMAEIAAAALEIHAARLQPAYLFVNWPESPELAVGLVGGSGAVAWQEKEITDRLTGLGLKRTDGKTAAPKLSDEARASLGRRPSSVAARITVRPTDTPAAIRALLPISARLDVQVSVGVIDLDVREEASPAEDAASLAAWTGRVRASLPPGAHLVWTRVPVAWTSAIDVWGPTRPDFHLMHGIKRAFDPTGLFSPGRFVGRL